MSDQKYHGSLRLMHWLIGIIVLGMLVMGFYMTSLPKDVSFKYDIYGIHKPIGLLVLGLVFMRIFLRLFTTIPQFDSEFSRFDVMLAKIVHYALYVALLLMPISGYVMSSASGKAINFLGEQVPLLVAKNNSLATVASSAHTIIAYTLITLIVLHILGAFKHLLFDKRNIFKRMI